MNRTRLAGIVGAISIALVCASAAPCPKGSAADPSTYSMAAAPDAPKVGQNMNVTIRPTVAQPLTAVCLDGDTVEPTNIKEVDKTTYFEFTVPGDASQGELTGVHTISVLAADAVYSTRIGVLPLRLDSVTSLPLGPGNEVFRVTLNGAGFDQDKPDNNRITVNDYPLEVCWSESGCKAGNLVVRGRVTSGNLIELSGMDPIVERSARFRVWINGRNTEERTDSDETRQYWSVVAVSAAVTVAIIGLVILLVVKWLRPTLIDGEHYVGRALFLDKETNTYSLSKLQFYLWTSVVVFGYVYLAIARNCIQHYFGLPAVPSGLPGIVGIAGGTAVGAQVVTNINGPKGAGQLKPSLSDFVTSGDAVAADRVQFFVWTIIGTLGFLMAVVRLDPRVMTTLPDVPSSLLAISGLSAFGYLGGKLARDPGPVITETIAGMGPDPNAVPAATPAAFGLIELRGRMLSRDAKFRVSTGEESGAGDIDISFDLLQPSTVPKDEGRKVARVIETDSDSTDPTMAKRLLLVINVTDDLKPVFVAGSTHTITMTNPDSEKAVVKFKVPAAPNP